MWAEETTVIQEQRQEQDPRAQQGADIRLHGPGREQKKPTSVLIPDTCRLLRSSWGSPREL